MNVLMLIAAKQAPDKRCVNIQDGDQGALGTHV